MNEENAMIYDINIWIAEALFHLMGGIALLNSLWILVWIVVGTVTLLIPFYLSISAGRGRLSLLPALVFMITFFPILIVMMGPPIIQVRMLEECETVTIDLEQIGLETVSVQQCRTKDNYYGEFGPWQFRNFAQ